MATIFWSCGFEAGDWDYYESLGWWRVNVSTIVTNATSHKRLDGDGGSYALFSEDTTRSPFFGNGGRWLHFWMAPGDDTLRTVTLQLLRYGSYNIEVVFRLDGTIRVNTSTIVAYGKWCPGVPHWIAIEAVLQNSGGTLTVKVDGAQVCSFTGDTQRSAVDGWDQIQFQDTDHRKYLDDIIITTDNELDPRLLPIIKPDGDSTPLELSPSTGTTHYDLVNTIPVVAGYTDTYNAASAVNQEDNYTYTTLTWTPASIEGVVVYSGITRDGSITQGKLYCNGVAGTGQYLAGAGSWFPLTEMWTVDPSDSNPWTKAKIDSFTAGIEFL